MQWLDTVKPSSKMTCTYCKRPDEFKHQISFAYSGHEFFLFRCPNCGSLMYDPQELLYTIPKPYTKEYMEAIRMGCKYYLESGYAVDFVVQCALAAIAGCPQSQLKDHLFVDVGAGLGLASYFVKNTFDVEVVVIEPSYSGELGKEMLGMDIHNAYFEDLPAHVISKLKQKPTLLHLNSVVEHLRDPAAVIRELMERTQVDAIAAVVPDGDAIDTKVPFTALLPFLAPGDHLHLPTITGMEQFYRNLGFEHYKVRELGGLLVAVGSRFPIELPTQDAVDAAKSMFLNRLIQHENVYAAWGAAGRLLPGAVCSNDQDALKDLRRTFDARLDVAELKKALEGTDNWDVIPFNLGSAAFWLGVDRFNQGRFDDGHAWMGLVELFADRIGRDFPHYSMEPLDYKWEARIHRSHAFAAEAEGKLLAAKQSLESVIRASADTVSGPRPDKLERARKALRELKLDTCVGGASPQLPQGN